MKGLKRVAWVSLGFAVISLLAMIASHLALTDISRGEGDLSGEWRTLQIGFLIILAFHVSAVVTLAKLLRLEGKQPDFQSPEDEET
jgi:hypothetical protein